MNVMQRHHKFLASPSNIHWGFFEGAHSPIGEISYGDQLIIETVFGGPKDLPDSQTQTFCLFIVKYMHNAGKKEEVIS